MVDRLEIIPGDVRGGGNITTTKQDFKRDNNTNVYHTKLTESNTFVNGKLMTVFRSSKTDGWDVSFDAPRVVCPGDTVTVNFTASHLHAGSSIHDISATLFLRSLDGETVFWEDTYSSYNLPTSFTVTVPEDCDSVCEWFLFISHSVYQNASCHRSVIVSSDLELDFDVFSDKSVVQTGEIANIVGLVTGSSGESVIGVPGQTVNFYEQWTPGLRVSATPSIIQSGEKSSVKAQLIDTVDGSFVREAGHTVNVYREDTPVPTGLDVRFDKSILSYIDGDSTRSSVTVRDQFGEGVPYQTISVSRSDGVSFTVDTDEYGRGYFSYVSQGIGDVVFTFECGNLQETYTIEDCSFYDSQTSSKSRYTTTSGSANIAYSPYGVTIAGTTSTDTLVKNTAITLPDNNYILEVTLTLLGGDSVSEKGTAYGGLCVDNLLLEMYSGVIDVYQLNPLSSKGSINTGVSNGDILKIEKENGTLKIYINNEFKMSTSVSFTHEYYHRTYKRGSSYSARSITAKDLKIKLL